MPSMKPMKKAGYGGKAFNTNSKVPGSKRGNGPKGFVMGNKGTATMGAGRKAGSEGGAMGTAKGKGGKSY